MGSINQAGNHKERFDDDGLKDRLAEITSPLRCIDRVAANIDDILAARGRKVTWDTIADAMGMRRCTLINSVKTLQSRNTRDETWTYRPSVSPTTNQPEQRLPAQGSAQSERLYENIKTVGRARLDQFNF